MTAPPRTLLLTSLLCSAAVSTAARVDAQPARLPDDPGAITKQFRSASDVISGIESRTYATTSCRLDEGVPTCTCLRAGEDHVFSSWSPGEIRGFVAGPVDELVGLGVGSAIAVEGLWVLRDVDLVFSDVVLHADELHIDGARASMVGLSWHERAGDVDVACGAVPARGPLRARAKRAEFDGQRWRLRGYRVGPWPVSFARSAHGAAPGLLPPVLRAAGDSFEAELPVHIASGVFAFAAAGVEVPTSLGVGLVTDRATSSKALRAMLALDGESVEPMVLGDVAIGGRTHLRGHIEHPSVTESWALRRAETGGFFRDWRRTHLGAAASGEGHALQLAGSVLSEPGLPDAQWAGIVSYGTAFESGRYARWMLDVEHVSVRDETTRHSTTTALALRSPLGWAERAWVEPGADLVANYGAVTVARGFDASTTLSVLASMEAGLAFEGRFDRFRHRIAPVLRIGGEVAGVQQRQAREGAPPYPYERPEAWRWGAAILEQSMRTGDIMFQLPIGVFGDALGDESIDGVGGFARASAVMSSARVDLAAACVDGCERAALMAAARVTPRRGLNLAYSVSDLGGRDAALLFADQLTERAFTALRLINDDDSGAGFTQVATISAKRAGAYAAIEGRVGDGPESRGLGARAGWVWEPLGWGIGVSGAWAPAADQWALAAGLSLPN